MYDCMQCGQVFAFTKLPVWNDSEQESGGSENASGWESSKREIEGAEANKNAEQQDEARCRVEEVVARTWESEDAIKECINKS